MDITCCKGTKAFLLGRSTHSFQSLVTTPNADWQGTTNVSCVFMAQQCLAVQCVCPDSRRAADRTISVHVSTHAPLTSRTLPLALSLSFAWCHLHGIPLLAADACLQNLVLSGQMKGFLQEQTAKSSLPVHICHHTMYHRSHTVSRIHPTCMTIIKPKIRSGLDSEVQTYPHHLYTRPQFGQGSPSPSA